MTVDVTSEAFVARPRAEVYAYAADPGNAPRWYVNIKEVEWKSDPPLCPGSRLYNSFILSNFQVARGHAENAGDCLADA